MSNPVTHILQSLKSGYSILTFPYHPEFDKIWEYLEEVKTSLWTFRALNYDEKLLPIVDTKLHSQDIPNELAFDLIISHDQNSHNIGIQLSSRFHVPLCHWCHDSFKPPAHYHVFSSANVRDQVRGVGPLIERPADFISFMNNVKGMIYEPRV